MDESKIGAMNADEAAAYLGIGRTKFYELLSLGLIPRRRIGRRVLFLHCDLQAFLENLGFDD